MLDEEFYHEETVNWAGGSLLGVDSGQLRGWWAYVRFSHRPSP